MDELEHQAPEQELPEDQIDQNEPQPTDPPEGDSQEGGEKSSEERVKNAQRKMHQLAREKAELERRLSELTGKVDTLTQVVKPKEGEQQEANPFEFLDDKEFLESLYDDPKNMAKALKQIVTTVGSALQQRDRYYEQTLAERVRLVDPEYIRLKPKIEELRKDQTLADLPEEKLAAIARKMVGVPKEEEDTYRGSLDGTGRRPPARSPKDKAFEEAVSAFERRLYKD